MNILSLFDGMSCGQIALNRAGIKYDNYFASEIKPHAIKVTQHNYPNTIQIGDVTKIKAEDLPVIDLLIGGSPCQDFSQANKERKGLQGEKSSLFFEYVRLLKDLNPKYFLLENVSMDDYSYQFISETLGTYPVNINSELVSAQLRQRSYWTNIGAESFDLFGNRYCMIPQPKDKKIMLQDILESGKADRKKSLCIMARYKKSAPIKEKYEKRYKMGMLQIVYDKENRLLTTKELERLQTVPEGYVDNVPGISENMKANLLGDGWTVDVVAHIFSFLPNKYKVINLTERI